MAQTATITKIKTDLRISHSSLDTDIGDQIDACVADLTVCGISDAQETDPLVLNAIKLWMRANYTDDTEKAAAYMERYNALKACLMMAAGYGGALDVSN